MSANQGNGLTVAVVIITYLRPNILRATLGKWLESRRAPEQFIVVDASPDAESQRVTNLRDFTALFRGRASDYLVAAEPSTTSQRNQALDSVWTDAVMFLDDESQPEPSYVDKILEVFELDRNGMIGGVGGSERDEEWFLPRFKEGIRTGAKLVARSFPMSRRQAFPPGVLTPSEVNHLPLRRVRQLYGAKMSFRTALLNANRFDERMLRYGFCEDLDISLRISRTHALVQRTDAFVGHDEARIGRIGKNARFLVGWTNPSYITEKYFPGPSNRRPLDRLLALSRGRTALRYLLQRNELGRRAALERFEVAAAMIAFVREGKPETLGDRFSALQARIFGDVPDEELALIEPYRRWETEVRQNLNRYGQP